VDRPGLAPATRIVAGVGQAHANRNRTRVRLTHDRLAGDLRVIHDEGWTTFLTRLAAAAAGTDMPAYPPEGRP